MPTITATLESPIHRSFRVAQVAGMFGETIWNGMKRFRELQCEVPGLDEDWRLGLIVGPSGSGKSTIAREAFGDAMYEPQPWPRDRSILDRFGDVPTKQIVRTLTAVGLSSPPAWVRPYHTLSMGERFRCDLARALSSVVSSQLSVAKTTDHGLLTTDKLLVFDEFASVVDRTVARVCSAAVAKYVRRLSSTEGSSLRFVAVTCRDDVAEWLGPDWILDMGQPHSGLSGHLLRRRLRRPPLELSIHCADRDAWPAFAPHHYLSGVLHRSARCYVGYVSISLLCQSEICNLQSEIPVAFAATLPLVGRKKHRRFHRLVVLPAYQGIGIGSAFLEAVAELHREEGLRINIATSHPAIITHCRASSHWRTIKISPYGRAARRIPGRTLIHSLGRAVVSFEYVGRPSSADPA
jgi:GNAT superfamily N-acetyltransferase